MATYIRDLTGPGITSVFGFAAADLGYLWDSGQGFCLSVFGDTFDGDKPGTPGWRSPVALRTATPADRLDHGIVWDNAVGGGYAKQLFDYRRSEAPNFGDAAFTVIPSDGATLPDGQHLISAWAVGDWTGGPGGTWRTNYAELFYSDQIHGEDWRPGADIETGSRHYRWYNQGRDRWFQNQTLLVRGDYLYVFGTPCGRQAGAGVYLMRAPWRRLWRRSAWQWWGYHDGAWSWGDHAPSPIFASLCPWTAIGEINVRDIGGTLVFVYADGGFCWTRTAAAPDRPWTPPRPIAHAVDLPCLYAPAIHPWSRLAALHLQISQWVKTPAPDGRLATTFYGTRQWRADAKPLFDSIDAFDAALPNARPNKPRAHLIETKDPAAIADWVSALGGADVGPDTVRIVMPGIQ